MATLSELAPDFASEVEATLRAEGYGDISSAVPNMGVESCTFDSEANMGYIRFVRPVDPGYSRDLAAPVKKTIPFAGPHWFNIDIDHDGVLFGIELDGRADVVTALRANGAL